MLEMLVLWMGVAWGAPEVALPGPGEVVFDVDTQVEVDGARVDLAQGRFLEAARRFGALADAGGNVEARYLSAMALYEAGELNRSARAAEAGLLKAPNHVGLLLLSGLICADQGLGEAAAQRFDQVDAMAGQDATLRARVRLNRGVVHLDRGEVDLAEADFRAARSLASAQPDLVSLADRNLAVVAGLRGRGGASDLLSAVSERLRRGDLTGARAVIPTVNESDRRSAVHAQLAEGSVARAEGRFEAAAAALETALSGAREVGLYREEAAALAELGVVYALAGRLEIAADRVDDAIARVSDTSFRLNEMAYRVEAGRIAARAGKIETARAQLKSVRRLSGVVQDAIGAARIAELEGLIAAKSDRVVDGVAAYDRSIRAFESFAFWAEAARVATAVVEVQAGRDAVALASAKERAEHLFKRAGDPFGPAHVGIAEGIGAAARGQLDAALDALGRASAAAVGIGGPRGEQLAKIAQEDAAQVLLGRGHSTEAVVAAKSRGLEAMVEREREFVTAETAYSKGRTAFAAARFAEARAAFDDAFRGFDALGEAGFALKSRRGRAWAEFNATTSLSSAAALPAYHKISEEALFIQEPELRARAMAAVGLAAADEKRPEAVDSLRAGADAAERAGLYPVAGQCQALLAEKLTGLEARVVAARKAMALRGGDLVGVQAMVSVAVDAYNGDQPALARVLALEVLPKAGSLGGTVQQIIDATR